MSSSKSDPLILPHRLVLFLRTLNSPAHPEETGLKNTNKSVGMTKLYPRGGGRAHSLAHTLL